MKKKLTSLVAFGVLCGICYSSHAMNNLPAPIPANTFALKGLLADVHAEGVRKIEAAKPISAPTSALILANQLEATALRLQLMALYGARGLGATVFGSDGASPIFSDVNSANDINLVGALLGFLNNHANGGAYAGGNGAVVLNNLVGAQANSILSHYHAFAGAVGDADVADDNSFQIAARAQGQVAADRRKDDLVLGLTVANLTNAHSVAALGGGVSSQDCLWMGLLALAEMAEIGSLADTQLDEPVPAPAQPVHVPLGYTDEIMTNIKAILSALN